MMYYQTNLAHLTQESYHFFCKIVDSWFALVLDCKKNLSQGLFKSFEFSRQKAKKKKKTALTIRVRLY